MRMGTWREVSNRTRKWEELFRLDQGSHFPIGEAKPSLGAVLGSEELQAALTKMLWRDTSHSPNTGWSLSPALTSSQTFTLFKNILSEKMSVRVVVVCVWRRQRLKPNEHLTITQHLLYMTAQIKDFYNLISFAGLSFQQFVRTNATQWIEPFALARSKHAEPQASFYTDLQRILVKAAYFSGLKSLAVRTMEKWVTCTWHRHRNTQSSVNDPTGTALVTSLSRLQAPNCRNGLDRGLLMWLSSSTVYLQLNLHTRVAFL